MKREIKIYKRLENGKFEKAVNNKKDTTNKEPDGRVNNGTNRKAVIRLSDGKEYRSIQKCRIDNHFCRARIYNELEQGTNFKLKE